MQMRILLNYRVTKNTVMHVHILAANFDIISKSHIFTLFTVLCVNGASLT